MLIENSNAKRLVKSYLGRAASSLGLLSYQFDKVMTVVAFHRVNDKLSEDGLTCRSTAFEDYCNFFKKNFDVVPLADQVARIRAQKDVKGTLSITFDDGYLDNFEVAAPVLRRHNLPATFFVVSSFIGSDTVAAWDRGLTAGREWMTWDHVRQLSDQGFTIGCHTKTHIDMGKASTNTIRNELSESKAQIEQEIGQTVDLFAYPYGGSEHISQSAKQLVLEAGFSCCLSCFGGVNSNSPDPYDLQRVPVSPWYVSPYQFGLEISYQLVRHSS